MTPQQKHSIIKWQKDHPDEYKIHQLKWQASHPQTMLFNSAKQRAAKHSLEFTITKDDIHIPEFCPLLGVRLTSKRGVGRLPSNVSIDRIDPMKGYTPDNIQVVSDLANRMKQDATKRQLIAFARNILLTYLEDGVEK